MSNFKAESGSKTVDCGECSYCKKKCSCPGCNGYSIWGGCGGCRNLMPAPCMPPREYNDEHEHLVPGGPEGVGVYDIPDCRWEACGGTRYTDQKNTDLEEEKEEKDNHEFLQRVVPLLVRGKTCYETSDSLYPELQKKCPIEGCDKISGY